MDDLQARLDAAITEAREAIVFCSSKMVEDDKIDGWQGNVNVNRAIDRYAALVAVREWYRASGHAECSPKACDIRRGKDAEAERLLEDA